MNRIQFVLFLIAGFISIASEEGVAEGQNKDRTGTPDGSNTCDHCHDDGGFSPTMLIAVENGDGVNVTSYIPGETYRLLFDVDNFFPIPSVTGFQATVLNTDLSDAGTFSNPSNNAQLEEVNTPSIPSRHIVEHNAPSFVGHFEVDWTAPISGGEVRIYASGVAADGDDDNDGDNGASSILVLPEASPDGLTDLSNTDWSLMTNALGWRINHPRLSTLDHLEVRNVAGTLVLKEESISLPHDIDYGDWPSGVYVVQLHSANSFDSFSVLRR